MRLRLRASYGYRRRKGVPTTFELGEGLVGQSALERKQCMNLRGEERLFGRHHRVALRLCEGDLGMDSMIGLVVHELSFAVRVAAFGWCWIS